MHYGLVVNRIAGTGMFRAVAVAVAAVVALLGTALMVTPASQAQAVDDELHSFAMAPTRAAAYAENADPEFVANDLRARLQANVAAFRSHRHWEGSATALSLIHI